MQFPLELVKPWLQVMRQAMPSQVALPLSGGAGQAVHEAPQDATLVFETQALPHWWKPAAQTEPQLVPLQVATPLAGATHAVQLLPQLATLVLETQAAPHW